MGLNFSEALFMQVRVVRKTAERWGLPRSRVLDIFKRGKVLEFVEECYSGLHTEGDDCVVDDIEEFLRNGGIEIR